MVGGTRFALDDPNPRRRPQGLTFSSSWQGGDEQLSFTVAEAPGEQVPFDPYDRLQVLAAGGATCEWDGEARTAARSTTGGGVQRAVGALGYSALLEDRRDVMFLGIDRLPDRWRGLSLERRRVLLDTYTPSDGSAESGRLKLAAPAKWDTSAGRPNVQIEYDARPLRIGRVEALWGGAGELAAGSSDGNWVWQLRLMDDTDDPTVLAATSFRAAVTADAWTPVAVSYPAGAEVANLVMRYEAAPGGETEATYELGVRPAVIGDHGLPLSGSGPADYGLSAPDVWAYIVREFCPDLEVGQMLVQDDIPITQLAEWSPTTPGAIWNQANAFHGNAWDVIDRRVYCHPFGQGPRAKTWLVRADDPAVDISDDGLDASDAWSGIVVSFTDVDGRSLTVGPPGSTAHVISDQLQAPATNPAVRAGRVRLDRVTIESQTTLEAAIRAGMLRLAANEERRRRGRITIRGHAWDDQGVGWPCFRVRGGHFVRVTDDDTALRRILRATYDDDSGSVTLELDNQNTAPEAFLAYLYARTAGVI